MSATEFTCNKCFNVYSRFDTYKSHVLKAHTEQATQGTLLDDNAQYNNSEFKCDYCNVKCGSKYTLKRHIDKNCKAAPNRCTDTSINADSKFKSMPLLQVTPQTISAIAEIIKASLFNTGSIDSSNSKKVINNDTNTSNSNNLNNQNQIDTQNNNITNIATQNNTQNNLQVNQDIHINPLGKENLSHISKADILEMLHLGAGAVPALARAILELPENRNIAGYDKKNGKVMFVNRKGKVEIGNLDKVIGWFTEDNIGRVNNYITEYDEEFPPNDRLIQRLKVMQGHETIEDEDEEEHNRIYQTYFANCSSQLKDAIEVNSKQALLRIKKFHDFIEQNKVLGYFPPSTPNFHRLV